MNLSTSLLLLTLATGHGAAHAQSARLDRLLAAIPAGTHDWGCEVLLCLSNPDGPTAVTECVPPIRRLWHELARGHAFPTCAMATGPDGRSYALPGDGRYDPCPTGTTALGANDWAQLSPSAPHTQPASPYLAAVPGHRYRGIATGDASNDTDPNPPPLVCVGGPRGSYDVAISRDASLTIDLYDTVLLAPAQASSHYIDVYIDDTFWQRVRW